MTSIDAIRQQTGVKKAYIFPDGVSREEIENELGEEDILKGIIFEVLPYLEEERGQTAMYFSISSGNQTFISMKTPKKAGAIVADENANIGFLRVIMSRALS
ncbi:hypothetical protein JXA84_02600 [candidate division WOR-3 bacterium]|nr:hypothetical protein [candidate division WOR-3 bacterium]